MHKLLLKMMKLLYQMTKLKPVMSACIYHRTTYENILKYIEETNYEIIECPREYYIDGIWNKENLNECLIRKNAR